MVSRYLRQESFLGKKNQVKLRRGKVLIIGLGALGTKVASNLVRSGVKEITIVDKDKVEEKNLLSQFYTKKQVGMTKARALKQKLREIDPKAKINAVVGNVDHKNIEKLVKGNHVVVDGTDNIETRFIINEACVKNKVPWVYGTCAGSNGMTAVFMPRKTCFRCMFPKIPSCTEDCETEGLIDGIASVISGIQTTEVLKILTGKKSSLYLIIFDIWKQKFDKIKLFKNKKCETCVKRDFHL